MLISLFKYPAVLDRHRNAPLYEERNNYLRYRAQQGCKQKSLLRIARELLQISKLMQMSTGLMVSTQQIEVMAEKWARRQYHRGRVHSFRWSRGLFVQVATDWLKYLGRLDKPTLKLPPCHEVIEEFCLWMDAERGLSSKTIYCYRWHLKRFLQWCEEHEHPLADVQVSDIDAFLGSHGDRGWCRVSIAASAKTLKSFFNYAGQRGLCSSNIASAIQRPRLYSQGTLPAGPSWEEVERLIRNITSDRPRDIRDRAIILLFALYGLRSGEVTRLSFEDIDWENSRLSVYRSKQRKAQIYPLISTVGNAIIRYLQLVRQQTSHRNIFLTLKAPLRPLSTGGLYNIVSRCIIGAGIQTKCKGPHALRHACAMHLVTEGLSLKEIGDHLGHRSASATRIYAKVNLAALKVVADLDLGGLS
jgi:integrase/recombinase XerD